ncbi:hypothetical protein DdX_12102 [Ditylenchus destructor]|uniref:Uncharacterized protein n=1 Tax=Ditylenchus destructor TaxID=166010 RepID=A0AAD4MV90_9BILA|nr:hypothetical protein DdX_12102 [Ditylenchus destructor]
MDNYGNPMDSRFGGSESGVRSAKMLDRKYDLPQDAPWAGDCIYFNASNSDGWYLNLGLAQRQNNLINLFFVLKIPNVGLFVNPELVENSNVESVPSSNVHQTKSGFKSYCIEPMREWRVTFKGKVIRYDQNRPCIDLSNIGPNILSQSDKPDTLEASFDLTWTNFGEYFDFDVDISPEILAHSLAIEPWSRSLFEKLKSSHQSHYEQFGHLKGDFKLGGDVNFESGPVDLISMRDHTITRFRRWSQMRRYLMLVYHLEDGTCIHTSIVSMPDVVFTHLQFGYVITPQKQKLAVDSLQLHLSDLGEQNKEFPKTFYYSFRAGAEFYNARVEIKDFVRFKMGLELACFVQENLCEFYVNGIKGYGFAEAEYRIDPY